MDKHLSSTPVAIFFSLLCCALWGSAFPLIKIGYKILNISASDSSNQIVFAGIRFTIAGTMVIIVGSIVSKKVLVPKNALEIKAIGTLALVQTLTQYFFFYIGLANTTGSKAAITESLNVFFAVFISSLIFHFEKITLRKLLACLIGLAGVMMINIVPVSMDLSFNTKGDGFIMISTTAYALSTVMIKKYGKSNNSVLLSGWQFLLGGITLLLIGQLLDGKITIDTSSGLLLLVYLSLVSAAAYTIWGLLLKYNSVSRITIFGFFNPIFGVLFSAILLNETQAINIRGFLALILVCIGIFILNYKPSDN